jgi:hypothetical protein
LVALQVGAVLPVLEDYTALVEECRVEDCMVEDCTVEVEDCTVQVEDCTVEVGDYMVVAAAYSGPMADRADWATTADSKADMALLGPGMALLDPDMGEGLHS